MEIMNIIESLLGRSSTGREIMGVISFLDSIAFIAGIIMVALGIANCFFGFRFARIMESVAGFFLFGGISLALFAFNDAEGAVVGIVSILMGALGAFLAYKFMRVGIFIICFISGFLVGFLMGGWDWIMHFDDIGTNLILGVAVAAFAGFLGLRYTKAFIIVCTGLSGGFSIGLGVMLLGAGLSGIVIGLGCMVAGCIIQFNKNRDVPMKAVSPTSHKAIQQSPPVQKSEPVNQPAQQAPQSVLYFCNVCGKESTTKSSYCHSCGSTDIEWTLQNAPVQKAPPQSVLHSCKVCGKESTTKFSHCPSCGSDDVSEVSQPAQQADSFQQSTCQAIEEDSPFQSLINSLYRIFDSNEFLRAIMSAAPFIMIGLVIFPFFWAFSDESDFAIQLFSALKYPLLFFAPPCLAKRKFGVMAISFTIALYVAAMMLSLDDFTDIFLSLVIELLLFGILTVTCYVLFFKMVAANRGKPSIQKTISNISAGIYKSSPTPQTSPVPQSALYSCNVCGKEGPIKYSYCPSCGSTDIKRTLDSASVQQNAPVQKRAGQCPSCNALCDVKAKFCPKCGNKLIK